MSKPTAVKMSGLQKQAKTNRKTTGSEMDAFIGAVAVAPSTAAAVAIPEEKEEELELTLAKREQPDLIVSSTPPLTTTMTEIQKPVLEEVPSVNSNEEEEPEESKKEPSNPPPPPSAAEAEDPSESGPMDNGTSLASGSQIKLKYTYKLGNNIRC